MDIGTFFKNGDPSQPTLNMEGSFSQSFQGGFADEKLNCCGDNTPKVEPSEDTYGFVSREDRVRDTVGVNTNVPSSESELQRMLAESGDSKISTGAWIGISVAVLIVFGGLGYILYKKYK
jgi:hypothetical protein